MARHSAAISSLVACYRCRCLPLPDEILSEWGSDSATKRPRPCIPRPIYGPGFIGFIVHTAFFIVSIAILIFNYVRDLRQLSGGERRRARVYFDRRDIDHRVFCSDKHGSSLLRRTDSIDLVRTISPGRFQSRDRLRNRDAQNHGRWTVPAPRHVIRPPYCLSSRTLRRGLVVGRDGFRIFAQQLTSNRAYCGRDCSRFCHGAGARNFATFGRAPFHQRARFGFSRHGQQGGKNIKLGYHSEGPARKICQHRSRSCWDRPGFHSSSR